MLSGRGLIFDGEIHEILFPIHHFLREQVLEHHRLPLWNPYLFFGYPWLGAIQAGPLYPLHWLFDLAMPVERGLSLDIALHFLLAGGWMYLFARRGLRVAPAAALAAASVFAFNGHMTGNLAQLHNHATLAWAPLVLLAIQRAIELAPRREARRWMGLAGLALGLSLLGGMTQQSLYLSVVFASFSLALAWRRIREQLEPGSTLAIAKVGMGIALLALAIFGAQWHATQQLLGESARALTTSRESLGVRGGSLSLADAIGLFFPNLRGFGALGALNTLFVGVLPLALAIAWAWRALAHGDAHDRVFTVVLVAALAFAAGEHDPLVKALYGLPLMHLFRDPARAVSMALLAVSVLAARALDALRRDDPYARNVVLAGLFLAGLAVGAVRLAYWANWVDEPEPSDEAYPTEVVTPACPTLLVVSLAAAGLGLLLVARSASSPRTRRALPPALALTVLGMLAWFADPFMRTEKPENVARWIRGPAVLESVPPASRCRGGWRVANLDRDDTGVEPFETEFRWLSTSGFSSLAPLEVLRFTRGDMEVDPLRLTSYADYTRIPPLLDLSAARHLLARRPFLDRGEPASARDGFFSYENRAALPRVFRAAASCRSDAATALALLRAGRIDPRAEVVTDHDGDPCPLASAPDAARGGVDREVSADSWVEVVEDTPDHVRAILRDGHAEAWRRWLVLLDRYAPGWTAHVNGQPATIHRADFLFRAVEVPEGTWQVDLDYKPRGMWALIAVSLVAMGVALTLAVWPWSRRTGPAA